MAHLDVSHVAYVLPDGRELLRDVSFHVNEGARAALIAPNGAGKTTLLRIIMGELPPAAGTVSAPARMGAMSQFIGSVRDDSTVRSLLLAHMPKAIREAGAAVAAAEAKLHEDEDAVMRYAQALADWGDAGGYEAEVLWDICTVAALGLGFDDCADRPVNSLSGGEQKRLVLELLLRGDAEALILDEPDNYLDVPGKRWLEEQLCAARKTILYVSHDRELLSATASQIVTLEEGAAWTHGGGYATYNEAREARHARLDELHANWERERERLVQLVYTMRQQAAVSADMASRYRAMQTRLRKFDEAGPPAQRPREQKITMNLAGSRTGERVVMIEGLSFPGIVDPFDAEIYYGDRVGVLGRNGTGKTHLLGLLGGLPVEHTGSWRLGARVVAGLFSQTNQRPELLGRTPRDILWGLDLDRGRAMGALRRYELDRQSEQPFETMSGGQQARFQILLLEIEGATLLLLDEPTDNLDIASAEALESALRSYQGTVMAVTHDRWFARTLNRFLLFHNSGAVRDSTEPVWD